MKKFISILLCAVLLSTLITVFAVPAMANEFSATSLKELYGVLKEVDDGDTIYVYGNGGTWYVNQLIYIDASCHVEFHDITFMVGDYNDDLNFYNGSLIEVNQNNTTLDFYNCTFDTEMFDVIGDGGLACDKCGSAIYVDGHNCSIDGHNSTVFQSCRTNGKYGGAIYIDHLNNCSIRNATFKDCESSKQGGAIYVWGNDCIIGNCKFSGNTAPDGGLNVYSCFEGETTMGGCTDTDGNTIDESSCVGCEFESIWLYRWNTNPDSWFVPDFPEEGVYIIRSANRPDYCLNAELYNDGITYITIGKVGETQFQNFRLERVRDDKNNIVGDAYRLASAWSEKEDVTVIDISDQLALVPHDSSSKNAQWLFTDALDGENCYFIRSACGGFLEEMGIEVEYYKYDGSIKEEWILERVDAPTGSTISEGNVWIIAGIGVVAVVALAVVVAKKKKKPAPAEGEVTVTENTEKTEE